MADRLLGFVARINSSHPWSHNDPYSPFVVYQAWRARRAGSVTGLDVGCGTGTLLRRLARVLPAVTGLEADPTTANRARESIEGVHNADVVTGAFPADELGAFDFVSMVAVLHHVPLGLGVRAASAVVSPGGRLVIVGCYREEPGSDLLRGYASLLLNPLVGLVVHPRRASTFPANMTAPVATPTDSYEEIRDALRAALPGVKVRRGLFWRYTAVWVAPVACSQARSRRPQNF